MQFVFSKKFSGDITPKDTSESPTQEPFAKKGKANEGILKPHPQPVTAERLIDHGREGISRMTIPDSYSSVQNENPSPVLSQKAEDFPENWSGETMAYLEYFSANKPKKAPEDLLNEINQEYSQSQTKKEKSDPLSTDKKTQDGRRRDSIIQEKIMALHQLGYEVSFNPNGQIYQMEKIWNAPVPIQVPIGISNDPRALDWGYLRSISLIPVLFELERAAQEDGQSTRLVIFDSPQTTNYLNSVREDQEGQSGYQYIRSKVDGVLSVEKKAHEIACKLGEKDQALFESICAFYQLEHIAVKRLSDIEKDPFYITLKKEVAAIFEDPQNAQLKKQLLATVDDRFLKRAKIGIKGEPNSPRKEEVHRELAEYGIHAVTLHLYNLGDTLVHDKEAKNYRLTQAIIRNKALRDRVFTVIQKFKPDFTERQLMDIQFPKPAFFQGLTLGKNGGEQERYKTYTGPAFDRILKETSQVLLAEDSDNWTQFRKSGNGKRIEFAKKVLQPLLAGHYHFMYGKNAATYLERDLAHIDSWDNLADFIHRLIIIPLGRISNLKLN